MARRRRRSEWDEAFELGVTSEKRRVELDAFIRSHETGVFCFGGRSQSIKHAVAFCAAVDDYSQDVIAGVRSTLLRVTPQPNNDEDHPLPNFLEVEAIGFEEMAQKIALRMRLERADPLASLQEYNARRRAGQRPIDEDSLEQLIEGRPELITAIEQLEAILSPTATTSAATSSAATPSASPFVGYHFENLGEGSRRMDGLTGYVPHTLPRVHSPQIPSPLEKRARFSQSPVHCVHCRYASLVHGGQLLLGWYYDELMPMF